MVSYRQLNQFGIKQIVKTTGSSRPKALHKHREDQFFRYEYDSRDNLIKKEPKNALDQYRWWYKYNVQFSGDQDQMRRITPLTEFEKQMGVVSYYDWFIYRWCNEKGGNCIERHFGGRESRTGAEEWREFMTYVAINGHPNNTELKTIDYGNLRSFKHPEHEPTSPAYFKRQAELMGLEVIDINNLQFREKQKPAVVEKVRPNPKEKSIASVKIEKPEPIEPIEEVAKYSPLMIAGVIAVVVILLLKRRRA